MLPPGARDPDQSAQLMMLALGDGQAQAVASHVDLRSTLVWQANSSAVTYEQIRGSQEEVWLQPRAGGTSSVVAVANIGERLIPVADQRDAGILHMARFGPDGVDFESAQQGTPPQTLRHLANGAVRNLSVAPEGGRVAFLATGAAGADLTSRAFVLDPSDGSKQELPEAWGEMVGLAWRPDGTLVVGSTGSIGGLRTLTGTPILAPTSGGFLQPLAWSPSGQYLAVRVFSGPSAEEPGSARDALLTQDGKLEAITDTIPVRFVGWVAAGAEHDRR
jgi:hypothetical protein